MKKLIVLALVAISFSSCTTTLLTRGSQYPQMYVEKPATILIMPPINKTTFVDAKEYFYTSLSYPLCEKGYYVVSPFLAMDLFQSESAYDSETFIEGSLTPFKDVFGADAAMFTIINGWKRNNIGGIITVDIEYILRSTQTGAVLFNRKGVVSIDCSTGNSGNALLNLALTTLNTATTDKVIAARRCNYYVLQDLPNGKYAPLFDQDKETLAGKTIIKATVKK